MISIEGRQGKYHVSLESLKGGLECYAIYSRDQSLETIVITDHGKNSLASDSRLLEMAVGVNPGKEYKVWDDWTRNYIRPGLRSQVFVNRIKKDKLGFQRRKIVIKQPLDSIEGRDSTALEQLEVLEAIRSLGFLVVPALLATLNTNRLVLDWYQGKHPFGREWDTFFTRYLDELNGQIDTMGSKVPINRPIGHVDAQPANYFIGDPLNPDIRKHFVVLDPVCHSCLFQF